MGKLVSGYQKFVTNIPGIRPSELMEITVQQAFSVEFYDWRRTSRIGKASAQASVKNSTGVCSKKGMKVNLPRVQ